MNKSIEDSVRAGFGLGIFVPGMLISLVWWIMHRLSFLAKADLLLIGCIAVNAILLKYFFKVNKENTGRGILSATFVWGFLFFCYKISRS